jgi:hypothetical protein
LADLAERRLVRGGWAGLVAGHQAGPAARDLQVENRWSAHRRYRGRMVAIVPSYLTKLRTAKEDLVRLEEEIERYVMRDPYRVAEQAEGRRRLKVRRLQITSDPANTDIPRIAGGILYNLRSGLDHLMAALVPKRQRGSAHFPIFFQGVWEHASGEENEQLAKERGRWRSDTKALPEPALAIMRSLQPLDGCAQPQDETHVLQTLRQLANADDHARPPVAALGLSDCMVKWTLPDGRVQYGTGHAKRDASGRLDQVMKDGSKLKDIPCAATNVEITGVPVVAIHIPSEGRYVPIPQFFVNAVNVIEQLIITPLIPFVRPDAD